MLRALLLAAVSSLAFAPAPLPRHSRTAPKTDLDLLQGVWVRVGYWEAGAYHDLGGQGDIHTVRGDRVELSCNPRPFFIKPLPDSAPKAFDAVWREGFDDRPLVVHQYAHRIDQDTWTVARLQDPEAGRPRTVDGTDARTYVSVFKRKSR